MPYYNPLDYLDNTEEGTLAYHLNCITGEMEQRELDVPPSFFDPVVG